MLPPEKSPLAAICEYFAAYQREVTHLSQGYRFQMRKAKDSLMRYSEGLLSFLGFSSISPTTESTVVLHSASFSPMTSRDL